MAKRPFTMNYQKYDTSEGYGDSRSWRGAFFERMSDEDAQIIIDEQEDTPRGILGLGEKFTQDDLKAAFKRKMMEWHPDRNGHRMEEATKMAQRINAAYSLLKK